MKCFIHWLKDKNAATGIEYALIAAGIALAILASVTLFGETLQAFFYEDLPAVLGME